MPANDEPRGEGDRRARRDAALQSAESAGGVAAWSVNFQTGEVHANAAAEHMLSEAGLSFDRPGELPALLDEVDPRDREKVDGVVASVRAGEASDFHAEFRLRRDGGARWVAVRGEPIRDRVGRVVGARGAAYDVDDWMTALEALRTSEAIFHNFAEASRDFMWIADPNGNRTIYINPAYEAVIGGERQTLLESFEYWRKVVHPDDIPIAEKGIAVMLAGGARELNLRIIRPDDGRVRVLDDRGFPILDETGAVRLIGGVVRDITDLVETRAELERRVAERTRELEESLEERRKSEAALAQAQRLETVGRLTGGVAHDFNNLLTVIIGALDMMQRRPDQPELIRRFTQAALEAGRRGERLTRQLLSFSRRQELRPEKVDLRTAVVGFEPLLRGAAGEAAPLTLEADDVGAVWLDKVQLEAALLNLVVNAHDALTENGRIRVRVEGVRVKAGEIADVTPGDYARISVIDNGAGMAPEVLARAFEPFFTTKPVGKGTGLGLAQVYGFARQSGGGATIDSVPGQGTSVHLYLPIVDASATAEPSGTGAGAPARPLAEECRVLLVDDDPGVRAIAEALLRDLGCDVVSAADGASALEALKADPGVRLLLSDIVMPGMSGVELAREAQALRPDLKVLLSTGYASDKLEGADAKWPVLRKPYQAADLTQATRLALA